MCVCQEGRGGREDRGRGTEGRERGREGEGRGGGGTSFPEWGGGGGRPNFPLGEVRILGTWHGVGTRARRPLRGIPGPRAPGAGRGLTKG